MAPDAGADTRDTRFLGDLYQDPSEAIRRRYALLQTPEFVEEFILDQTLDPAITEFGLEDVTLIDPTCGSGHFLLGAFRRLLGRSQKAAPGGAQESSADGMSASARAPVSVSERVPRPSSMLTQPSSARRRMPWIRVGAERRYMSESSATAHSLRRPHI